MRDYGKLTMISDLRLYVTDVDYYYVTYMGLKYCALKVRKTYK